MLGIAFCASIGGTGMLTGTGPNLISVNQAMQQYGESVTFVKWSLYATPACIVMTIICWGVLTYMFLMDKDRNKIDTSKADKVAAELLANDYKKLGPVTFPEYMIIGKLFSIQPMRKLQFRTFLGTFTFMVDPSTRWKGNWMVSLFQRQVCY